MFFKLNIKIKKGLVSCFKQFYILSKNKIAVSKDRKADATFGGMVFLGLAIIVLLGNKISAEIQGFILLFFIAGGYFLAYHPKETKRIAGAFADVVISIIDLLKKIIIAILKRNN